MDAAQLADALTRIRSELVRYLTRLTGSPEAAEDAAQSTYVRACQAPDRAPSDPNEVRRWLFRIATNLALDELRRRKRWMPTNVVEIRELAEASPSFMERSAQMVATPEVAALVREHIDACFGCVVRNLPSEQAAAVLLRELHQFSYDEVAEILGARPTQVKNWIQTGRRTMQDRYAATCALITKTGICHQCTELSDFFQAPGPAAVGVTDGSGKSRTRHYLSCHPLRSRIRHKRSRTCCRLEERGVASAALRLHGDIAGRTGWLPQTPRSYRAGSCLEFYPCGGHRGVAHAPVQVLLRTEYLPRSYSLPECTFVPNQKNPFPAELLAPTVVGADGPGGWRSIAPPRLHGILRPQASCSP